MLIFVYHSLRVVQTPPVTSDTAEPPTTEAPEAKEDDKPVRLDSSPSPNFAQFLSRLRLLPRRADAGAQYPFSANS